MRNIATENFMQFYRENKKMIIILVITTILLFFIRRMFFGRVDRCLSYLDKYKKIINQQIPLDQNKDVMKNNYILADFYICSSHKSYLPCTQYFDYSSPKAIEYVLKSGARYVELDIFNKGFCRETIPVVTNGVNPGNWHYTTDIDLEDCFRVIKEFAFSDIISNKNDPLILCLNLNIEQNDYSANIIAKLIKQYFGNRLLGSEYSYQRKNISLIPIKELFEKMIIISNISPKDTELDEFINYNFDLPFMRNYSNNQINEIIDREELINFNKRNITRVYNSDKSRNSNNFNPYGGWFLGCQFVTLNFQNPDKFMNFYIDKFKDSSFALKPIQLRYTPLTYKEAKKQSKKVSFAPKKVNNPYYTITY